MRTIGLTRTEAEQLVDLLEVADPLIVGTWQRALAAEIREKFGMCGLKESLRIKKQFAKQKPRKVFPSGMEVIETAGPAAQKAFVNTFFSGKKIRKAALKGSAKKLLEYWEAEARRLRR